MHSPNVQYREIEMLLKLIIKNIYIKIKTIKFLSKSQVAHALRL